MIKKGTDERERERTECKRNRIERSENDLEARKNKGILERGG